MYMMELGGAGPDLHPTGRVVVYSNSVLFQPAAIFKQMPGTNYTWRTVLLTLAPETDFQLAEKRLTDAVMEVFEQYRAAIEKQHAVFERAVEMQFQTPKPDCHLRFSDTGLEFVARYPVELARAREVDERIMKALFDAISQEPQLTLAPAGTPRLQAA
jgi:small-conductance mechanosensitive channel